MALPFYISCNFPSVGLFELEDGSFQPIAREPIGPYMAGPGYLLVEKALADYLQELKIERVQFSPAVIFIRSTGEELRSHVRVKVGQSFSGDQLNDLALGGCRLLSMNDQYYFASPELKNCLEASQFKYLVFSEGLGGFAANAT
jgi:hypothetical protein